MLKKILWGLCIVIAILAGVVVYFIYRPDHPIDGENYYYGIGVPQDYKKALACFQKEGESSYAFLIMMYLNGDGTEVSPQKALEVWNKEGDTKTPDDVTYDDLETVIKERLANPGKTYKKLTFDDIAMTTFDMDRSAGIRYRIAKLAADKQLAAMKKSLDPKALDKLNEVEKNYHKFVEFEIKRSELFDAGGSISGIDAAGVKTGFENLQLEQIQKWLIDRKLDKWSEDEFQKTDKELNVDYQKVFLNVKNVLKEQSSTEDIKYFDGVPEKGERAWIKYRDAWVELLKMEKPIGFTDDKEIETSVKTELTLQRIEDLKNCN